MNSNSPSTADPMAADLAQTHELQVAGPSPLSQFDGDDACWAVAATHVSRSRTARRRQAGRPAHLPAPAPPQPTPDRASTDEFLPRAPKSLAQIGITEAQVEALILKFLLNRGSASGSQIREQIKLPLRMFEHLLGEMKNQRLLEYTSATAAGDFVHRITEIGIERARRYSKHCTYCGAAPVSLEEYSAGVRAQSVRLQSPSHDAFHRAFRDLVLGPERISQIGQAVTSGLAMFLHGAPGNGKTSIAERVTRAFSETIWIPRAISVWGEIIRLYDPSNHQVLPPAETAELLLGQDDEIDRRWIRIRRPTIVAGGELRMENLEINTNPQTGISEAPLQMKSNCGTLVIDDFGRQRISPVDLLNRWIVPLEKRHDYLSLSSGRKIQVPFEQLIIFSTNLAPQSLVDEAFLRRIPYKIDVQGPDEAEFRKLFRMLADQRGVQCDQAAVDRLLSEHYQASGREMRFCHPRDLLDQIETFCRYHGRPRIVTPDNLYAAAKNYFTMM